MIYKKRLRRKVYFVDDSEFDTLYADNIPYRICTNRQYKKVSIVKYGNGKVYWSSKHFRKNKIS